MKLFYPDILFPKSWFDLSSSNIYIYIYIYIYIVFINYINHEAGFIINMCFTNFANENISDSHAGDWNKNLSANNAWRRPRIVQLLQQRKIVEKRIKIGLI